MTFISKVISSLVALTAVSASAVTAENVISNDISRFKGKSFEEVYKNGKWKVRFFKTDLAINIFLSKHNGYEKYYGLNGDDECQVKSAQHGFYWLFEMTQNQFENSVKRMENNSHASHLLLVEFNKEGDWFGRGTTYAWFGFSGNGQTSQNMEAKKKKNLEILKSNQGIPSSEVFDFLKSENSKKPTNTDHLYVHERLLLSPLKLDMEKSGNCGKWKIPKEHITTI